ncbi:MULTISPECIES: hypothetical protein [Lysobacter]|uniref:DUF2846 domain-containing protein n=1 Tax=Lysobacter gummosus TaxID=262324 RepID=A0ABY3XCW5_9GAMM|nr:MULTISPECIES: hypothetical protein [Lysobacter]UJB19456.1 DUF2846 domain-containing protein [Lysobacter capsici]UJQ26818.1 DUF2846 domain-containing protein [Lysobacter gummosus]UNP29426.1 DUF2846 domain-containing protein [Lysobacter gummosus]
MMSKLLRYALLLSLLCSPVAFAKSVKMDPAADQNPKPEAGKALVVFLRSSFVGSAISSSVYEAPDSETRFLGVVQNKNKLAVQVEPGDHRFMVIAENADFLDAKVDAGKTYYVLISPRPGAWKARFSLLPIHNRADAKYSVQSADFTKWMASGQYVAINAEANEWYEKNKASVAEKKADYLIKWNKMAPADRQELVLHAEDGVAK